MRRIDHIFSYSFFLLILLTLSSCVRKKSKSKPQPVAPTIIEHAKETDIPIPVGYACVAVSDPSKQTVTHMASYHGRMSMDQVATFYKQSMERLGWAIDDLSNEKEALLVCKKRSKSCAISIRGLKPQKNKGPSYTTELCLFVRSGSSAAFAQRDMNSKTIVGLNEDK